MISKLLIGGLLVVSSTAFGADFYIGERTHHFAPYANEGQQTPWKDTHALLAYCAPSWCIGGMQNSFDHLSLLALHRTELPLRGEHFSTFLAVGAATGYQQELPRVSFAGLTPVVYLVLDLHAEKNWGVNINYMPGNFIGVSLRVTINK